MAINDSNLTDAELMRLVQSGRVDRFGILIRRYQGPLLRVARSRLGRLDWAEEVVQETFLAAFKSRHTYRSEYSFRTWLWTILFNQCKRYYGRVSRGDRVRSWSDEQHASGEPSVADADVICDEPAPLKQLLAKERAELLEAMLDKLKAEQADALRLRFFGGLKFQEIADTMSCSLATAKNRVRWGLLQLSRLIETNKVGAALQPPGKEPNECPRDESGER